LQPRAVATSTDGAFEGRGGGFAAITKQHAIYLTINIMLIPLAGTPYCLYYKGKDMHGSNHCTIVLSHALTLSYPMTSCDIVSLSFIMSLLAVSLGLRFCVSRKGRTGEGVWVYPNGANSMAVSGLVEKPWLVLGGPILSFLA